MKALLLASTFAFVTMAAMANPVQTNLVGDPAQSQVYGDGSAASSARSSSTSAARSTSGSTATSRARGGNARASGGSVTVNLTNPAAGPTGPGTGTGPGSDPGTGAGQGSGGGGAHHHLGSSDGSGGHGGGHGGGIDVPVATAAAPAIMSFNPCSGSSASGAAQFAPFGLSFGTGGGFDNACRLHMLGQDQAAIAYLCRANSDIRQAFKDIGQPCPQDAPAIAVTTTVADWPYDWCGTRSAGDRNQHLECDKQTRKPLR